MNTFAIKVWLGAGVPGKIDPFAVTDNELILPPCKPWEICFDAWCDGFKSNGCELMGCALCVDVFQPFADTLWFCINDSSMVDF